MASGGNESMIVYLYQSPLFSTKSYKKCERIHKTWQPIIDRRHESAGSKIVSSAGRATQLLPMLHESEGRAGLFLQG